MKKENTKKLITGDQIIYGGGDEFNLVGFTTGTTYTIQSFYGNHYGVVVRDDDNYNHRICMADVENYFLTPDEWIQLNKLRENRVNHPSHYTWLKKLCSIEVIDITRHMNFNLGNVIKYVLRSGHKSEKGMSDKQKRIEDLKKAIFYLNDEIKRLEMYDDNSNSE